MELVTFQYHLGKACRIATLSDLNAETTLVLELYDRKESFKELANQCPLSKIMRHQKTNKS